MAPKKVRQRELWWVVHWPKPRSTQKQLERFKERTSRIWIRTVITNQHRMWRLVETYCEAMACCCQNPTAMASETALIYAWIFLDRLSHHNKKMLWFQNKLKKSGMSSNTEDSRENQEWITYIFYLFSRCGEGCLLKVAFSMFPRCFLLYKLGVG